MREEAKLWLKFAKESYEDALYNWEGHRYGNTCFCCQQALEKILKAILTEEEKLPPKSHDLIHLIKLSKIKINKKQAEELRAITRHYFTVRYPDLNKKFYRNRKITEKTFIKMKEFYQWFLKELKK